MICNICHSSALPFERALMLRKHDVQWWRCTDCGFIFTESPYWLDEAYSEAMTTSDVGMMARNLHNVAYAATVISLFFPRSARYLDWGGGYGVLTRMMRDIGYDYFCRDPHAPNLFARGFTCSESGKMQFELATAFEVFEHFVDPSAQVSEALTYAGGILFSTTVLPDPPPPLGQWWYYGLEHGQHVSLYTRKALRVLASKQGLRLYSCGRSLHLMTRRSLPLSTFSVSCRIGQYLPISVLRGPARSLIASDYEHLVGRPLD